MRGAGGAAAMRGKAVLITGGSGFIGTHLARRLQGAGAAVVSLDLKPPRETLSGAQYVVADVREMAELGLPKVDSIWNLAAVHTTPGHPDHEYYDTNVSGALEVTRLARSQGVQEIVFTSSISVYGPSEERKTEASTLAPTSAYGKSKLMAEKIQGDWQAEDPTRHLTIIRPAVVFGQGEGGNFARMAALLKKGVFVFPGRRDTIKSCIYVEDLVDLMLAARSGDENRVLLNGAYPECPTLEQIVTTLQGRYFPRAKLVDVPRGAVMAAAKAIGALNGVGGIHPDRVTKLLKSTHVYPQWAVERGLLEAGAFDRGVDRWAEATGRSFV
jgi:nucleoside-diphosphate-sugar epimerase